jgi:hypothetical protein
MAVVQATKLFPLHNFLSQAANILSTELSITQHTPKRKSWTKEPLATEQCRRKRHNDSPPFVHFKLHGLFFSTKHLQITIQQVMNYFSCQGAEL